MPSMTTWEGEFTANTTTTGIQDQVRTFQLHNGDFWVTWRDDQDTLAGDIDGLTDILGQRYDPLGNPIGGPVRLNGSSFNHEQLNAQFVANPEDGGFVAVYETHGTINGQGISQILLEYHAADGSLLAGGGTVAVDYESVAGPHNAQVAIASSSSGLVVWERTNSAGDTDIMARFFEPFTHTMSPAFEVLNQADDNYDPHVVALANGNYAVIWTDEYNGSSTDLDIRGKIYAQDGTQVGTLNVATSVSTEADASITALAGGGFVVSYTKTDASNNGDVLFRIYDASGVALAPATLVVSGTNAQGHSSVSATADGGFMFSWVDATLGKTLVQAFTSTGLPGEVAVVADTAVSGAVSLTTLGDGRLLAGYGVTATGDAQAVILDPRSNANATAAYTPEGWQIGTQGNESLTVAPGTSHVHAMDGDDHVYVEAIVAGGTVDGGAGEDTLHLKGFTAEVEVDLEAGTAISGGLSMTVAGFENYFSAVMMGEAQIVHGTSGYNSITTGDGDDVLDGGAGSDLLAGRAGNDTYYVDSFTDNINEVGIGDDHVLTSVSYALELGESLERLSTTDELGTAAIDLTGNELANTITGNAGSNDIDGGAGADTMYGYGGDDRFYVDNAGDLVIEHAGGGNDKVYTTVSYALAAGAAVELLEVKDSAWGTTAIDLTGNELANTLRGNHGANVLRGGDGNDTLFGGNGDDVLIGGAGIDIADGSLGNDTYFVDNAGDVVIESNLGETDIVYASVDYALAADTYVEGLETSDEAGTDAIDLTGNTDDNTIRGNAGANVLKGGVGNDALTGLGGNDTLVGGTGTDTLVGGAGDDWYYIDSADVVVETAGGGTGDRILTGASYALAAGLDIERLTTTDNAGTSAINLTGNELAQTIYGNAGANTLNGKGGADKLVGLGGDDLYYVDNAGDVVSEGAGQGTGDRIMASVSYVQGAGVEVEKLTTDNNNATTAINLTGNELANVVYGNAGANVLEGKAGNDALTGLAGNDTLIGGAGNDTLSGGLGDDWYYIDSTSDVVVEVAGEGTGDRILTSVSYTLAAGIEIERLTTDNNAGTSAINLTGSAVGNLMYGNAGNNVLDGRGGADTLVGFGGNDSYYVDNTLDLVTEAVGGGSDRIYAAVSYTQGAGVHVETLTTTNNAGTGAINLTGNELANTIYGNAGANVLDGKGGNDALMGLEGADSFAFTTALGSGNVDTIGGFVAADDTIVLENAVFTGLGAGAFAAGAFATGSAATQADDRVIYNAATGALLFDVDGVGGAAAVQFATLSTGLTLTGADFVVI